jgi:uncharacterized protein YciI
MLYCILGTDHPDSLEKRLAVRESHLQRLQALQDEGRLVIAGPLPAIDAEDPGSEGFTGSLIVAEFSSLESARAWANEDPYVVEGVYADVLIKPFKKVFPRQS